MSTTLVPLKTLSGRARVLRNRTVWIGLTAWMVFAAAISFLAHGTVPFDQPMFASMPYRARVIYEVIGPALAFIFIGVTYALTRRRSVNVAARAPEHSVALRETAALLVYGAIVLIAGTLLGRATGTHRIGLHLTGSMFGLSDRVTPREAWIWPLYNFAFYAAMPYWIFRRRGYSSEQLCLKSSNRLNDTVVILTVLAIGLLVDLPMNPIWRLSLRQFSIGAALAFVFSLIGTGLSIMIFLTSILVPRDPKINGFYRGHHGSQRIHVRSVASFRVLDALRLPGSRRTLRDFHRFAFRRPRHGEGLPHPGHRQRLDRSVELPCHLAACQC